MGFPGHRLRNRCILLGLWGRRRGVGERSHPGLGTVLSSEIAKGKGSGNATASQIIHRSQRGILITIGRLNAGSPGRRFTESLQTWRVRLPNKQRSESLRTVLLLVGSAGPELPESLQQQRAIAAVYFRIAPPYYMLGFPEESVLWNFPVVVDCLGLLG